MADEIKPALTASAWARALAASGGPRESDSATAGATPEECAWIAALALHGQPFGFRHVDVDLLRDLDRLLARDYGETEVTRGVRSLADRIAALLPPRDP